MVIKAILHLQIRTSGAVDARQVYMFYSLPNELILEFLWLIQWCGSVQELKGAILEKVHCWSNSFAEDLLEFYGNLGNFHLGLAVDVMQIEGPIYDYRDNVHTGITTVTEGSLCILCAEREGYKFHAVCDEPHVQFTPLPLRRLN